ncbi:hypothetical protein HG536_0A02330 [Torulaspora globosa]|uniref:non-specific serine/threonine protein kinase n=1 Tax=Torulaspora globosa TaxID=48254 RepID=A0A7G3ZA80_9SACH|nr:uncharacterized protein HG536_0A02330 [Torulaspora globosa]QLL30416.1 hypothetical protein HG536_0A02330 [Torulaspora globosa]
MNRPDIGTYSPGVVLTVGSHYAKVLKYLTSGGFAQVYTAEIQPADSFAQSNIACLKRVIVPDKSSLNTLRAEVDAMKLLKNHKHVVSYIDSHAAKSSFQDGSYEVLLLMEYCAGGGLIDFMNTRLQNRLQEFEILSIMSQVTQGIAAMHALVPPLIHRDIKIENVLISHNGDYKVCDFGSVCGAIRPPKNPQEFAFVQHDVLKNTTAQYRAPEMIDLYRGDPIDEKSDIWALGVFLYKLCYYTTPFEKGGELAILHSRYQFPAHPIYSDRLKNLIRMMLMVEPSQRPNVCQTLEEVSRMQGVQCPIKNFYLIRAMQQHADQKQLHYSKTQPVLNVPIMNQPMMNQSLGSNLQAAIPVSTHLTISKSGPQLSNRPNSTAGTGVGMALLQPDVRPLSQKSGETYGILTRASKKPPVSSPDVFPSGRGDVNKIVSANVTSFDRPVYVDSVTQTTEPETGVITSAVSTNSQQKKIFPSSSGPAATKPLSSSSKKTLKEEQDHISSRSRSGGSVSTGTEFTSRAGNFAPQMSQASMGNREVKESIQKRVHDLLTSSEDLPASKVEHDQTKQEARCNDDRHIRHNANGDSDKGARKTKERPRPPPKPAHLRLSQSTKPTQFMAKRITRAGSIKEERENSIIDGKADNFRKKVSGVL